MQAHANDLRAEVDQLAAACGWTDGDAFVRQLVADWRGARLDAATLALAAFAEKLTRSPHPMRQEDIAALRAEGWDDRAIHDAVQIIAYFNYINRVADALGVEGEPGVPRWEFEGPGHTE